MDDRTSEIGRFQIRVCTSAIVFSLMAAAVFLFLNERSIAKGLVLGTIFSIINFVLLGRSISLLIGRSGRQAGMVGLASILSRYVILAVPMVIAVKSVSFNFIAVVVGIFSVQIVSLVDHFFVKHAAE